MNRCPRCLRPTAVGTAWFACTGPCAVARDDAASAALGYPVTSPRVFPAPAPPVGYRGPGPRSAPCPTCRTASTRPACPVCHLPLAPGWTALPTTSVVMSGARASGKSVYIGVMVKQLQALTELLGIGFAPLDEETATTYRTLYEAPLFEARALIKTTRPASRQHGLGTPPLAFVIGEGTGAAHALVIHDVAGENLEDTHLDPQLFGFFRHADAVFFLVDPLQVTVIRDMLAGVVPDQKTGLGPLRVLDGVLRVLRHDGATGPIGVPTAVLVSKFDALQRLADVDAPQWQAVMRNPGAAFQRDPSLVSPRVDHEDAALLELELRSLLAMLGGTALLSRLDTNFARLRLFAVSALGAPPSSDRLHPRGSAPFRVLDPVKWVLERTALLAPVTVP